MEFPKSKVYLSRRNLLALLSKLDREANGEETFCSIIKHKGDKAEYQQTMESIMIVAVDDDAYYLAQGRGAGEMHPADEKNIPKPVTGLHLDPIGDLGVGARRNNDIETGDINPRGFDGYASYND